MTTPPDLALHPRCFLFYGSDEAASRTVARAHIVKLGAEAQQVYIQAARLANEPTMLVDEANSASLFGEPRYILVDAAGDDCFAAVEALLAVPAVLNPTFLIAGALRKESRLVKLISGSDKTSVVASYVLDAAAAARVAIGIAASKGLRLAEDLARQLAESVGNDRIVLERELEKLCDFADASIDEPKVVTQPMLDSNVAAQDDQDLSKVASAVTSGDLRSLENHLSRSAAERNDEIAVVRAILKRVLTLAAVRTEVDRGSQPRAAVEKAARAVFWRDRETLARDVTRWSPDRIVAMVDRLTDMEKELKSGRGPGAVALERLLHMLVKSVRH